MKDQYLTAGAVCLMAVISLAPVTALTKKSGEPPLSEERMKTTSDSKLGPQPNPFFLQVPLGQPGPSRSDVIEAVEAQRRERQARCDVAVTLLHSVENAIAHKGDICGAAEMFDRLIFDLGRGPVGMEFCIERVRDYQAYFPGPESCNEYDSDQKLLAARNAAFDQACESCPDGWEGRAAKAVSVGRGRPLGIRETAPEPCLVCPNGWSGHITDCSP